jgi:hypothetical protein
MVIKVPTREAKGAAIAIIDGRENSMSRATWAKGTRLVNISWARSRSWLTKKTKKKKRKETKNEKKVSDTI